MKIYVLKNGLRSGPYSVEELRQQLDVGMFKPNNFASVDDCHSWTPINSLSELGLPSFSVKADKAENLLVIEYRGRVSRNDVEHCRDEIDRLLPNLDRDFQLLADFSKVEEMDVSCASVVAEIMDLCNGAGVTAVVRVIPEPKHDIGLQIMSLFHYASDVEIATCTSVDEARTMLARHEYTPTGKAEHPTASR